MAREVAAVVVKTTKVVTLAVTKKLVDWMVVTIMGTRNILYVIGSHTDSTACNIILNIVPEVPSQKRRNFTRSVRKSAQKTGPLS